MKWPWSRDSTSEKDVEALLKEANLTVPPGGPFRMTIDDVFVIARRGTVATGTIENGTVTVGQQVRLVRDGVGLGTTTVTGVEMFRKKRDTASAGETVGLLIDGDVGQGAKTGDALES